MSPMRKTAGRKAAATRKHNAAKRKAAAKKAASTRKSRAAGKEVAKTSVRQGAARKAAATRRKKEAALLSQCKSKNRPHQNLRCRPHPKPASPSKRPKTSKASAHELRLFPFTENRQPSLHQSWVIDSLLSPGVRLRPREFHAMSPRATKKQPTTDISELQEFEYQIRRRAYELYEERGREDGHELEDWLHAEEEIREKKVRTAAA